VLCFIVKEDFFLLIYRAEMDNKAVKE